MHLAEDRGLYVKSVCRGVPSCAECRVRVTEGEGNVLPPGTAELQLIGTGWFIDRRRLACQLHCMGDATVDLSEQIAKKDGLIGGRKTKKAQSVGDRVEEEITIRDNSASSSDGEEEGEQPARYSRPQGRPDRSIADAGPGPAPGPRPQGQGGGQRSRRSRGR